MFWYNIGSVMKYLKLRGNTWYYRRKIPTVIEHLSTVRFIYRPLSTDKSLALKISERYNNIFTMINVGLKLGEDISNLVDGLKLSTSVKIDSYKLYLQSQNISEDRMQIIERQLAVSRLLLPTDLSKINIDILDVLRSKIIKLPRRTLANYRGVDVRKLTAMDIPVKDRLSPKVVNSHLKVLNSFLKYLHERDAVGKLYRVILLKSDISARDERVALNRDTVLKAIEGARTAELASSYALLYLTGFRPSEVLQCKITTVDGIKCFDLTDRSIKLKNKSSYRLVPVHHSITNPEKMLEDYKSTGIRIIARKFKESTGTLYSLRHSFATELAAKGIEPHIISELLGHTHQGMTMSRYVKSLPVSMLREAIDTL